jgi:tetratricopeptide (TPR) repeat protein
VYRAFATREPNSEFSPGLSQQAIEAYRKGGFTQLVLEGKREYVALYNYGTTFWDGRNKADYPNIAKELKLNLKDVATYFHANAQKSKKPDEYLEAARWYRTYLDSFPDDPDSFGTNYLLSETLYEARDYQNASVEFTRTAYDYPRNPALGRRGLRSARLVYEVRGRAAGCAEGRGSQGGGGCRNQVRYQPFLNTRTARVC